MLDGLAAGGTRKEVRGGKHAGRPPSDGDVAGCGLRSVGARSESWIPRRPVTQTNGPRGPSPGPADLSIDSTPSIIIAKFDFDLT